MEQDAYELALEVLKYCGDDIELFVSKLPRKTSVLTKEIMLKLIDERRISPSVMANLSYTTLVKFTTAIRNRLVDYANETWKNETDIKKIAQTEVAYYHGKLLEKEKLIYFYNSNKEVYNALLQYYIKELDFSDLKELFLSLFNKYESNKTLIMDILRHNFELVFTVSFFNDYYNKFLQDLEKYDLDISRFYLDKNDPEYIELKEHNKDYIWNYLVKVYNEKNYPSFYYLRDMFAEKGVNFAPGWNNAKDYKFILKTAREEEKWNALTVIAEKGLLKDDFKPYSLDDRGRVKMASLTNEEIYEYYKDKDISNLPHTLIEFVNRLIWNHYPTEDRLKVWNKELFTIGNHSYGNDKNECEKILNEFLNSSLNIDEFCKEKAISSPKGFKKMLDKFSLEENYNALIKDKNRRTSISNITKIKSIIKNMCENDEALMKNIQNCKEWCINEYISFCDNLLKDTDYKDILVTKVINYYYDRLTSYESANYDEENVMKFLTNNEIRFILGKNKFEEALKGFDYNLAKEFLSKVTFLNTKNKNPELINEKCLNKNGIPSFLKKYNTKATISEYKQGKRYVPLANGELIQVSEEVIDRAFEYVKKHNIYCSNGVINHIIKSIINNKIAINEEVIKKGNIKKL